MSPPAGPDPDPGEPALDAIRPALQAAYREIDAAIRAAGPVCAVSGRCCRFDEYGHTLFLSRPEALLLAADAPEPPRPLDDGATCPWQDHLGRCQAREARPLGCRVYFCDPAYQDRMYQITEDAIAQLKRTVDRLGLDWDYAPLHRHLRRLRDEGRVALPSGSPA